jgi:hypothetical protein
MNDNERASERRADGIAKVPLAIIRKGIEDLRRQPLSFTRQPQLECRRNFDCYLEYNGKKQCKVQDLGPLARWLIAIDLLTREIQPQAKIDEALGLIHDRQVAQRWIKRMFGMRAKDEPLMEASRFKARDIDASDATDGAVADIGAKILHRLNQKFKARRQRPITIDEFLAVHVPLRNADGALGDGPIEWFRNWLMWGAGTASIVSDAQIKEGRALEERAAKAHGNFQPAWDELLPRLVDNQVESFSPAIVATEGSDPDSYEHIVNVHSAFASAALDNFAAAAYAALRKRASAGRDALGAPAVQVVYVSLKRSITCVHLLQQLYEVFSLDSTSLQPVHRGERSVDLAADLDPIRRVLTVNKVVVIFHGWETIPGPFATLHEYLCHTNWGEVLRVLAQPHIATVRAAPGEFRPSYQLLLLSRGKAAQLGPWAHYTELSDVWSEDDVQVPGSERSPIAQMMSALAGSVHRRADSLQLMRTYLRQCAFTEVEALIVCMIAASISGMRRSTLRRCLGEWDVLFGSGRQSVSSDAEFDQLLNNLLATKCAGMIDQVPDEEVEALSPAQRYFELDREPSRSRSHRELDASANCGVAFVTHELRGLFVSIWLESNAGARAVASGQLFERFPLCSWAHVNFLLAEECLRQATSQFRHSNTDSPNNPYSLSRSVQALVHGLATLDLKPQSFPELAEIAGGLYGLALPVDAGKRYRYLYGFLYRRLIEGGGWRLGRSFARSDLRLDILSLLLSPSAVPLILGAGDLQTIEDTLPAFPFEPPAPAAFPVAQEIRRNHALWCNLVEAIGHAGKDLGGKRGAHTVTWALKRLPHAGAPAEVNAALGGNSRSLASDITAKKLRVDWYQSQGMDIQLDEALRICFAQLQSLGIPEHLITCKLFDDVDGSLEQVKHNEADVLKKIFARFLEVQEYIEACTQTQSAREEAAEFLFRIGEILATKADDLTEATLVSLPQAFARSFAVYWVADRIRSSAGDGALHVQSIAWPRATARAMRYYVRVILKLARLLSKEQPVEGTVMFGITTQLLEQAQNRIGVYARHNFQFRRERDSLLILESSRLRAWVRIGLERTERARGAMQREIKRLRDSSSPASKTARRVNEQTFRQARTDHVPVLESLYDILESSWRLLEDAEALLIGAGFQTAHVRRLLLERTKTAIAFLHLATAEGAVRLDPSDQLLPGFDRMIDTYYEIARSSLDALTAAIEADPFWRKIIDRQEARLIEARSALNRARGEWRGTVH